jgi:hypothetical protein
MQENRQIPAYQARNFSRGQIPHLEEEKAHFLFLEVPADDGGAASTVAASPPAASPARADPAPCVGASAVRTSGAHTGAPAARAAPVVDCMEAGASTPAPGDAAPATGAGSGDGGIGSHLSVRVCPLTSSSSSSSSDDEYSSVPGEESPVARATGTPRSSARGAPCVASHAPFCEPPAPALAVASRARPRESGEWAARTSRCSRSPTIGGTLKRVNNSENWQNQE